MSTPSMKQQVKDAVHVLKLIAFGIALLFAVLIVLMIIISSGGKDALPVIGLFLVIPFYFIPTIEAARNKRSDIKLIFIINAFFGLTVIGWIIAAVLASKKEPPKSKQCPYCFGEIHDQVVKCKHCGSVLSLTVPRI